MIQGLDMSTYQRADMKCGIGSLIAGETCAFFSPGVLPSPGVSKTPLSSETLVHGHISSRSDFCARACVRALEQVRLQKHQRDGGCEECAVYSIIH